MGSRLELQTVLEGITENVYFQPPVSVQMVYPCIRYAWENADTKYADDRPYRRTKRYQVTVIDRNPDSDLPDQVADLPLCSMDRAYAAEKLNHWVFTLFF